MLFLSLVHDLFSAIFISIRLEASGYDDVVDDGGIDCHVLLSVLFFCYRLHFLPVFFTNLMQHNYIQEYDFIQG